MKTLRENVFETNSSSCHVVTILSDYNLERLKNNEILLAIYTYQGDMTISRTFNKAAFRRELEGFQFCHDYETDEPKYIEISNNTIESLCDELWDLTVEDMKTPVECYYSKVNEILDKYGIIDEDFKDKVICFLRNFAGKNILRDIFERMQKYTMPNGEVMNFSCIEKEC